MKYLLKTPQSIHGSRVEAGAVVELSEAEARAFDPADITPYAGSESGAQEPKPATTGGENTEGDAAVKPKAKRAKK